MFGNRLCFRLFCRDFIKLFSSDFGGFFNRSFDLFYSFDYRWFFVSSNFFRLRIWFFISRFCSGFFFGC